VTVTIVSRLLIVPILTKEQTTKPSWHEWLVKYQDRIPWAATHPGTNPARCRVTSLVVHSYLSGLDADRWAAVNDPGHFFTETQKYCASQLGLRAMNSLRYKDSGAQSVVQCTRVAIVTQLYTKFTRLTDSLLPYLCCMWPLRCMNTQLKLSHRKHYITFHSRATAADK